MTTPTTCTRLTFTGGAGAIAVDFWRHPRAQRSAILVHGGGQTRHSWRRTADNLHERGWAVGSFDARGHGDSSWSASADYTLDAFSDDVRDVVTQFTERTGVERPVLIGASVGGAASLLAQGRNPDLASALVLVDVTPRAEQAGMARVRSFMTSAPDGFADLEEAARAVSAYNPRRRPTRIADGLSKNLRTDEHGRLHWHWDPAMFTDRPGVERSDLQATLEDAARTIKIPTLLIRGSQSDIVTDDGVNTLRALIPHAQVSVVAGAGHMVAGDDNSVFTTELNTFLDALPDRP